MTSPAGLGAIRERWPPGATRSATARTVAQETPGRLLLALPGVEVVVEDPGCHGETRSAWDSSTRRRVIGPVVTAVPSTVRTGQLSTM